MKWRFLSTVAAASLATSLASAADLASKKAPPIEAPPPSWLSTVTVDGYVEGGIAVNPGLPFNKLNFGHLYTDRANWPNFNGAVLTVQRPIDSASPNYDFGFKVQGQIGTDARYNHLAGVLDYIIHDRTQIAILEANAQAHLPWTSFISQGGVDLKVGVFPTYNGAEVMYAKDNLFYSHSYIFNFGPFLHTGAMVTTHVRDWLDVYSGVTTGVNTSLGYPGDQNNAVNFHGGFGLTFLEGNLKINGIVHTGPENQRQFDYLGVGWPNIPALCSCDPNTANRTYTNLTTTWKATENLTLITDIAYNRESGYNLTPIPVFPFNKPQGAESYAIAQYASYKVDDMFTVNGRVEYYRDDRNFFVAGYPGYFDAINFLHGFACPSCQFAPSFPAAPNKGVSYLGLTAGVTITPQLPKLPIISGMIIRPEFRWDTSLNGAAPFFGPNGGRKTTQGMFNMDVIIPFSLL